MAPVPTDFSASFISGAHRLSNGNTLICEGPEGHLFEVTDLSVLVWDYINPVSNSGILLQGYPGVPTGNSVFRATRYEPSHPGLAGRDLTPTDPIEGY